MNLEQLQELTRHITKKDISLILQPDLTAAFVGYVDLGNNDIRATYDYDKMIDALHWGDGEDFGEAIGRVEDIINALDDIPDDVRPLILYNMTE